MLYDLNDRLPSVHDRIVSTERAIDHAIDKGDVVDAVLAFCAPLGISTVAMAHLVNPAAVDLRSSRWFRVSTWPKEWAESWRDQAALIHDPVARHASRTNRPFTWADAYHLAGQKGRAILDRSRDFGLNEGIAFPVHSLDGPAGCVTFGAEELDLSPREISSLQLVSYAAYARLEDLLGPFDGETDPELTDRESEVLHWVAAGKTDSETAQILDLSCDTVRTYVKRACSKLGFTARTPAVARAAARGFILPS